MAASHDDSTVKIVLALLFLLSLSWQDALLLLLFRISQQLRHFGSLLLMRIIRDCLVRRSRNRFSDPPGNDFHTLVVGLQTSGFVSH